MFPGHACSVLSESGIRDQVVLFMETRSEQGTLLRYETVHADPADVVYFVSKEDLARQVERLGYGKGLFVPTSRVEGVIDAFGWIRTRGNPRLAGFHFAWRMGSPVRASGQLCQANELARIIKSAPRQVCARFDRCKVARCMVVVLG